MPFRRGSAAANDSLQLTFAVCDRNGSAHRKAVIGDDPDAVRGQVLLVSDLAQSGSVVIPDDHDEVGVSDDTALRASFLHRKLPCRESSRKMPYLNRIK